MTDEQIKEQFDSDGFVVLREFFRGNELATLYTELERLIRDVVPKMPPEHVFYEDKRRPETLKQLQVHQSHDPFFHNIYHGGRIQQLAEMLLGDKVVGKNFQYFCKPPGVGQPTPPHQDGYYFKLTPCEALTMWLSLDEVDGENGSLCYVRGSHRRGMRPHQKSGVLGFSQMMADYGRPEDLENEVNVPAKPGDMLVHHAMTIHSAGGNQSRNRLRRSLGFVFFAERAKQDVSAIEQYQAKLKEELTATGKI
jgi:phytanoyl-CoA hydroxylase